MHSWYHTYVSKKSRSGARPDRPRVDLRVARVFWHVCLWSVQHTHELHAVLSAGYAPAKNGPCRLIGSKGSAGLPLPSQEYPDIMTSEILVETLVKINFKYNTSIKCWLEPVKIPATSTFCDAQRCMLIIIQKTLLEEKKQVSKIARSRTKSIYSWQYIYKICTSSVHSLWKICTLSGREKKGDGKNLWVKAVMGTCITGTRAVKHDMSKNEGKFEIQKLHVPNRGKGQENARLVLKNWKFDEVKGQRVTKS